jgi:ergothioneine biosynthesis protein EgtB
MAACRGETLARVAALEDDALRAQPDPEFSPIGWHLGHIAYIEALWLLPGGDPRPEWSLLFRQDGLPKAARRNLPRRDDLLGYLAEVRDRVLARLAREGARGGERLWHFLLQHEAQHGETIAYLRHLAGIDAALPFAAGPVDDDAMLSVPPGAVELGSRGLAALDNEQPACRRELPGFRISARPLSRARYSGFIAAGGYRERRYWSPEGWAWRERHGIAGPRYGGAADGAPVYGVSAHEAEACCRFLGARLPSEAEWERAARLPGAPVMLGEVWQWTSSLFAPYPGFAPFPYSGYSAAHFDGRHRVLKGGSRASYPVILRPGFRNWYEPATRQIFAGFRYVADV